jgi:DNA-directed RNA polymerase subunit RPC12/RpoP
MDRKSPQGVECPHCRQWLMAPMSCGLALADPEHVSTHGIRYVWRCSKCRYQFETWGAFEPEQSLPPELIERFLPSLLVARSRDF